MGATFPSTTTPGSHLYMNVAVPGTREPAIIVPSRLSAMSPSAGPLAGLRFAVKDIFHVKGVKTSGGSRAYYETWGPQNFTTETVQHSIDGGAALVGKTRSIVGWSCSNEMFSN